MTLFVLLAMCWAGQEPLVVHDHCDLLEHNRVYDDNGALVFEQILVRDWNRRTGRYDIRAWLIVKPEHLLEHKRVVWQDGTALRKVTSDHWRDTWTQYDPELSDREQLPTTERRGLTKRKR